jgi:hypothetical protein
MTDRNRFLTHDERKAAEAAFKGAPFDPKWSDAARKVYLGLSTALADKRHEAFEEIPSSQPSTLAKGPVIETKERTRAKSIFW